MNKITGFSTDFEIKTQVRRFATHRISAMRYRAKVKGFEPPNFDTDYLENWLKDNGFIKMWQAYIDSGKDKNLIPSIDRKDDYTGYLKENIQLMTWAENNSKGRKSIKKRESMKIVRRCQPVMIYNHEMKEVKLLASCREAAKFLGCDATMMAWVFKRKKPYKGYFAKYYGEATVFVEHK